MASSKGSYWSKWDLHIHTPNTKLSDHYAAVDGDEIWKTFCEKIEQSDVSAFGITDYFSVENHFTFLEKHKAYFPDSKKVFFPNIELRLDVSVNKSAEEVNIHVIFSNEPNVTKAKIDEFLLKLKTSITVNSTTVSCKNLNSKDDFEKATVNYSNIRLVLKEIFGKDECYLLLAAANNTGLRPDTSSPRKLNLTDEIDKICDGFFGGEQNVKYYLDTERYETDEKAKPKPVVSGCDAHSFDDCDNFLGKKVIRKNEKSGKDEILKNITWIKADLTFEGLRQIKFEPEYRVYIGENQPREPIRKIESITFNFPKSSVLKRVGSDDQELCIKHLKNEFFFSPYFTSIIGGRGTGKSTIINILAEKLGVRTDFFQKANNSIYIDNKPFDIESSPKETIEVKGTEEIEFVSQGQIEKLAEGDELTKLVFQERIRELEPGFHEIEQTFNNLSQILDNTVRLAFDLKRHNESLREREKEKSNLQKIIDSINDEKYKEITKSINTVNSKLSLIQSSRKQYQALLEDIKSIISNSILNGDDNEYEKRIQEILKTIKGIDEIDASTEKISVSSKVFAATDELVTQLELKLQEHNKELQEFFESKGTSEESIKDSKNASEKISRATQDIESIKQKIATVRGQLSENSDKTSNIKDLYLKAHKIVSQSIGTINERLKINNENVFEIKFTFDFNKEAFKENLFQEFHKVFNEYILANTAYEDIKNLLLEIAPDEVLLEMKYDDFIKKLNSTIQDKGYNRATKYVTVITNIFSAPINFNIYKVLIKKHLYNLQKHIKIKGFYGDRELSASSFGQRCTAVIVTLLMTGVKPLVIDEPEAHLDNRLIADYLVELIKFKKLDRQLIFATHNSNFVINGDSELIYILEIPDKLSYTNAIPTTIENISNREKLLKLEGGKEAFLSREHKYGLDNNS